MPTNTTTTLSNSVRQRFISDYRLGAMWARIYDRFAEPVGKAMNEAQRGTSVLVNFLSDLQPATSAISQTQDVEPVLFRDATATITPTSRANAVQDSELIEIQSYTNYSGNAGAKMQKLGKNAMESIELLAVDAALNGSLVNRATARASLDAGTTGHRLTDASIAEAEAILASLFVPEFVGADGMRVPGAPGWAALMHSYPYHDLRTSGNIDDVGHYQQSGIILDFALGRVGPFQIAVSPLSKVFWGAGADNGTNVATTLSSAANRLATSIVVASATGIAAGMRLNIGTEETGATFYPTNESVVVSDSYISGTTIPVIGTGDNGGLRFDHDAAEAVRNADSVFPILYAGPSSIAKLWTTQYIGPNGQLEAGTPYGYMVMPHVQGLVHQFASVGWKFYGGYGRWSENRMLRQEVAVSQEA